MRFLPGTASMLTNRLLATLPQAEWERLRPSLTRVRLVPGQVLIERGQATEHVFFIEEGLASLVADPKGDSGGVQVAMIGNEGLVGGLALLDPASAAYAAAVTQIPGPALRVPVPALRGCLDELPILRRNCLQYIQSMTRQIMQTAASNALNSLADRYVRWLLMAQDRVGGDELPVTHEALAAMLGVRRSGITVATATLHDEGLIRASRGRITILNRAGLESMLYGHRRRGRARQANPAAALAAGVAT